MPAKSQQQMKYIYAMRNKYKSKKKAPKNMKWVFDEKWTKGVKMKDLPKKIKESFIMSFKSFIKEDRKFNVDYEEDDNFLYRDDEKEKNKSYRCKNCNCKNCDCKYCETRYCKIQNSIN